MNKINMFEIVRQIPFPEVQAVFHGGEVKRGKMICPFHDERTASFQVFGDGFKCFGCGVHGDSIDFVAKLNGIGLVESARLIASKFNLQIDRPTTEHERQKVAELSRKRNIRKMHKELEQEAFLNLIDFRGRVSELIHYGGLDDMTPELEKAVHILPEVEEGLRILSEGKQEERIEFLREGGLIKWAKLS